jgi:hypothetical protein
LKRDHRGTRLEQHLPISSRRKAETMTTEEPPDTSTTNLTETGAEPDTLATEEAAGPATSRDYVTPLIHVRIPERAVNLGLIATLGAVAVVGTIELPVAGAAAAGLYLLRWKHTQHTEATATAEPA